MGDSSNGLEEKTQKAKKYFEKGDYQAASGLFEALVLDYDHLGDQLNSAENKNNCSVSSLKANMPQKAFDIVDGTDQIFAAHGDKKRQAMALGNRAAALEALGKTDQALSDYQKASLLLKEINDQELRPYILKSMAALEIRKGDYLQSLATTKASIEGSKKLSFREKILQKLLGVIFKN